MATDTAAWRRSCAEPPVLRRVDGGWLFGHRGRKPGQRMELGRCDVFKVHDES